VRWADFKHDWPNADRSEFISTKNMLWHVQRWGSESSRKSTVLLLHGTGSSTHSWRDLAPLLSATHKVIAVDLPGHAFTSMPAKRCMSIEGMASCIAELLEKCQAKPDYIIGHSAGAAIAIKMSILNLVSPTKIFSLNGALLPLESLSGLLFSPIAKLLVLNPLVPRLFSWRAENPTVVNALLKGTGSELDEKGNALYARLIRDHQHAAGALAMMASWNLEKLKAELPQLKTPLILIAAENDKTISPNTAARVLAMVPQAHLCTIKKLGHLAHEEDPDQTYALITEHL
jgi:magnesium chelatase accessory protein